MNTAFWYASRATGIVALLLLTAVLVLGILVNRQGRLPGLPRFAVTDIHRNLSLLSVAFIAVHILTAVADTYVHIPLLSAVVPFASGYERLWMSVGIVAGWAFVILGLSYYFRGRIGPQRWRKLHRFTALAWVLGVGHALMMGTDAGAAWFLVAAALVVVPAGALLVRRLIPAPAVPA